MDLISLAVPFFLLAIVLELAWDRRRGSGFVRFNDAIGSLATGAYNSTTGIFTKLIAIGIYAFVLEHFALWRMPEEWFSLSPRGVLAWLAVLLLWDFFYYWKHRLGHEMSIFWAAHSVHHQSEEYNLTTALRQTSTDFLVGWVVYLPMFLLGVPVHVFITVSAIDLIYQFWVHTRHIDRLGWMDYVFVTPSNHRVHHAQNARYIDKNYGGILIVWDRLFGTFEPESEPVVFGVRKPLESFNPVNANLHVYKSLCRDTAFARGWGERFRVWFGRTGWRPRDAELAHPLDLRPIGTFKKYEGSNHPRLTAYITAQFVLAVIATIGTGAVAMTHGLLAALPLALSLWVLLAVLGGLADMAQWAPLAERWRLLSVPLAALLCSGLLGWPWWQTLAVSLAYCAISGVALAWALSARASARTPMASGNV